MGSANPRPTNIQITQWGSECHAPAQSHPEGRKVEPTNNTNIDTKTTYKGVGGTYLSGSWEGGREAAQIALQRDRYWTALSSL